MSSEQPFESSPMMLGAVAIHEMFMELQKAGFSESQALYLAGQVLAASANSVDTDTE